VSWKDYRGPFLPGYAPKDVPGRDAGLLRIDHMVGNVELGRMNHWADWYSRVLGFSRYISFDDKDISTEYSALMSVVMSDDSFAIKFPINEPAPGRKKSQIEEYLDFYRGPGVQHLALLTNDIISTVTTLRANGVEFLTVPGSYYDALEARVGRIDEAIETNHKALMLAPDFAPAHNNLAIAYLEKEQYALAVEHCDKAVELGYEVAPQIRQEIEAQRVNLKK